MTTTPAATTPKATTPAATTTKATTPAATTPKATTPAATTPKARRSRRWLRLVVPVAVLTVLWTVTLVLHAIEEPNLRDEGTLSPLGAGPHGSSQLAGQLVQQGVTVQRLTSTTDVLRSFAPDATVFIPAPDYVFDGGLELLLGTGRRVILVRPGPLARSRSGLSIGLAGDRWAAGTAAPGCDLAAARTAGVATVRRARYGGAGAQSCYGGSLVRIATGGGPANEAVIIGATEPFRNDRIGEHGNAALAVGLLGATGRVIWLDLHSPEPPLAGADVPDPPAPSTTGGGQSTGGPGSGGGASGGGASGGGGGGGGGGGSGGGQASGDDSLFAIFPPALWLALALLVAVLVLLALARGRRLGGPVAEPLPVLVPAAETVMGRGRLYRQIGAHDTTARVLRRAAVARLTAALHPTGEDDLVAIVADRAGASEAHVRQVLLGPDPTDEDELVSMVAHLDDLERAALREDPQGGQTP